MTLRKGAFALATAFLAITLVSPFASAVDRKPVRGKPTKFDLSASEWEKVKDGGITVRHANHGQTNEFFSAGYVKAPVDEVFWYYEDHNNTPKYQDSIKKIDVEEDKSPKRGAPGDVRGGYRRLVYHLSLPFPLGWRHFVLDLEGTGEPGKNGDIWWSYNSGDIREMMGSYVITAYPDNKNWSLVRYWVKADMNTWIPGWLIGFVQGGTIKNVVAQARKDLEK